MATCSKKSPPPPSFAAFRVKGLIPVIAMVLEQVCTENREMAKQTPSPESHVQPSLLHHQGVGDSDEHDEPVFSGSDSDSDGSSSDASTSDDSPGVGHISHIAVEASPKGPSPCQQAFQAPCQPPISIRDYLDRLLKYTECSPACIIMTLVYIDRLVESDKSSVTFLSVHRLLLAGLTLATKYVDDFHFRNSFYSKVGGVHLQELNKLELQMLLALQFDLDVSPHTFRVYCLQLSEASIKHGLAPSATLDKTAVPFYPPGETGRDEEGRRKGRRRRRKAGGAASLETQEAPRITTNQKHKNGHRKGNKNNYNQKKAKNIQNNKNSQQLVKEAPARRGRNFRNRNGGKAGNSLKGGGKALAAHF